MLSKDNQDLQQRLDELRAQFEAVSIRKNEESDIYGQEIEDLTTKERELQG